MGWVEERVDLWVYYNQWYLFHNVMFRTKNSPATVMVRGPSCELTPSHSTIIPSTMEASDSELRVAVSIPPLESVRTPRNAGLPCVSPVLLVDNDMLNKDTRPWMAVHRMTLPGRVQVKVTVSLGQATGGVDVRVAAKKCVFQWTCVYVYVL